VKGARELAAQVCQKRDLRSFQASSGQCQISASKKQAQENLKSSEMSAIGSLRK
jgi:hypothetical protein